MQAPSHCSQGDRAIWRVYWTPELLGLVLGFCEWPTIMQVARGNSYAREIARFVVEEKMRRILEPFIGPVECFKSLIQALDTSKGGIVGSVVRRLLAVNAPFLEHTNQGTSLTYDSSFNLNIVVPRGQITFIIDWFTNNGWREWEYRMPACGYRPNVTTFVTARKYVGGRKVRTFPPLETLVFILVQASPFDSHREYSRHHDRGPLLTVHCPDESFHLVLRILRLSHLHRTSFEHTDRSTFPIS